jgi:hypothetical protein
MNLRLTKKVKGFKKDDRVIFHYRATKISPQPPPNEYGIVTSINDKYVFVKFDKDTESKAVEPDRLTKVLRINQTPYLAMGRDNF